MFAFSFSSKTSCSSWLHSPAGSTPWVSTPIEQERLHFLTVCVKQQAQNDSIRETRVHNCEQFDTMLS